MKTSNNYFGFLIDYVEMIIGFIKDNIRLDQKMKDDNYLMLVNNFLDTIEKTSQYIKNEKIKIKEHLFKHHESKNQTIMKEKEPDFSDTF